MASLGKRVARRGLICWFVAAGLVGSGFGLFNLEGILSIALFGFVCAVGGLIAGLPFLAFLEFYAIRHPEPFVRAPARSAAGAASVGFVVVSIVALALTAVGLPAAITASVPTLALFVAVCLYVLWSRLRPLDLDQPAT